MMKCVFSKLALAALLPAGAWATATYDAATNPGDLVVTVDAEGATLDAAQVVDGVTNIVKTGAGDLTGVPLPAYTGNFTIDQGCLLVDTKYDLGADNAGTVYINDGGTLRGVQKTGEWGDYVSKGKRFVISGAPAEGFGGKITRLTSDCASSRSWLATASTFDLQDDAVFYVPGQRLKIQNLILLNGHELAFNPEATYSQIQVDCRIDGDGRVVFNGRNFDTATSSLSVTYQNEGGTFGFRNAGTDSTLVVSNAIFEARNLMDSKGGSLELHNAYFRSTRHALKSDLTSTRWTGPVTIFGRASVQNYADRTNSLHIAGPIGGSGTLSVGPGWLNLSQSQGSTFSGAVTVKGQPGGKIATEHSGLALRDASPLFPQATSVTVADGASLLIDSGSATEMAPLVFSGDVDQSFAGGGVDLPSIGRPTTPSLAKSGSGALDLQTAVRVTGTATLAGGTLRFPARIYGHAGLMEGVYVDMSKGWDVSGQNLWCTANDKVDAKIPEDAWTYSRPGAVKLLDGYSNEVSNGIVRATAVLYKGYVWNRAATNETWQFAVHMQYRCLMRVNGTWCPWNGQGSEDAYGTTNVFAAGMKPGANEIFIYSLSANWNPGQQPSKRFGGMGIAYNPCPVEGVTNAADFVKLEDGGTGRLLTVDTEDGADAAAALLPVFGELACSAGATLDLNGNDFVQGRLSGFPTIAHGGFTVGTRWTVAKADVEAGRAMAVDGALAFADGAVVDVDGLELAKNDAGAYTVATATSVSGAPAIDPSCASAKNWRVRTSETEVKLVYLPSGTTILFR